jgi:hypothetical protein
MLFPTNAHTTDSQIFAQKEKSTIKEFPIKKVSTFKTQYIFLNRKADR